MDLMICKLAETGALKILPTEDILKITNGPGGNHVHVIEKHDMVTYGPVSVALCVSAPTRVKHLIPIRRLLDELEVVDNDYQTRTSLQGQGAPAS